LFLVTPIFYSSVLSIDFSIDQYFDEFKNIVIDRALDEWELKKV
jgi:hypothetical protein